MCITKTTLCYSVIIKYLKFYIKHTHVNLSVKKIFNKIELLRCRDYN